MKNNYLLLASLMAACAAAPSMAQQNTIKLGASNVRPHATSASDFSGPFTPSGISVAVLNKNTPFFSYTREINDQWDVELALGAPPTHDIVLKINNPGLPGSAQALNGQVGAKVRQVAPTLFVNYKFLEKSSPWRPFIGIGINYTRFDKTSSTVAGNALNGGATSIALEDSAGLALQGGMSYQINPQWSLSVSFATAQVKSKITTNTLGIQRNADITFRPRVSTLAVGYSF
ncbi:MAG: OmpW family outer membrane protein [Polaromonas sp.]